MSQTEPEGEITETLKPKRRFLRFVVRIVVPCLVLWMCWTGASKGYRWFKRYQASRLAVMAENYAKKEKWSEAVMSADTALSLNPLQPQALRFMAEIMAAQGRFNEAMELYGRLFFSGRGTLEDLKLQALNAVRAGYNEPAEYLATLVAERGEPGFPYIVKAEIHSVRGEKAQALEQLRKAVAVSHSNYTSMVLVRFLLANKQVREGDPEVYGLLWKMKKGTDEIALDALSMGLAANIVPREARLEWLQKIRSHPIKRAKSQLLADTAEVEIDPASKPRVVAVAGCPQRSAGPSVSPRSYVIRCHDEVLDRRRGGSGSLGGDGQGACHARKPAPRPHGNDLQCPSPQNERSSARGRCPIPRGFGKIQRQV
ncbi:hypothetical protein EBU02_10935 [bacterium]|nr:hypothetical protein [bacterium]